MTMDSVSLKWLIISSKLCKSNILNCLKVWQNLNFSYYVTTKDKSKPPSKIWKITKFARWKDKKDKITL